MWIRARLGAVNMWLMVKVKCGGLLDWAALIGARSRNNPGNRSLARVFVMWQERYRSPYAGFQGLGHGKLGARYKGRLAAS